MTESGDQAKLERALALVLMREALSRLDQAGEDLAAVHLQMAIDSLLRRTPRPRD